MNGVAIANTPIVVDYWSLKDVHPRSLFFLTHMHADHTSGLNASWDHPIYCTPITGKLLHHKFGIRRDLIMQLELDEPKIITVNCPGDRVSITVTALDANHCPGSAMFLFEGYFGTILYTGDFRFNPAMMEHPVLNSNRAIDDLYLDNTYCDRLCRFPSKEEAREAIIEHIGDRPDCVILFGLHTLGKEALLVEVAKRFKMWVGVSEERFETLTLLEMPDVFRTEMANCQIRVYQPYFITKALAPEMNNNNNDDGDYLAILPTAMYTGKGAPPPPDKNPRLKVVPYSDHSSFKELREFVRMVKPRRVLPIVHKLTGDGSSHTALKIRTDMSVFDEFLDKVPRSTFKVPVAIKNMLACQYTTSKLSSFNGNPRRSLQGLRPATKAAPKGVQFISPQKKNSKEIDTTSAQLPNGHRATPVVLLKEALLFDKSKKTKNKGTLKERDVVFELSIQRPTQTVGRCARVIPVSDLNLRHANVMPNKTTISQPISRTPPGSERLLTKKLWLPTQSNGLTIATCTVKYEPPDNISEQQPPKRVCKQQPPVTICEPPKKRPKFNSNQHPPEAVSDNPPPENLGGSSPCLKTLTIPLTPISTMVGEEGTSSHRPGTSSIPSNKVPNFLAHFPTESLLRVVLKPGPLASLHSNSSPKLSNWNPCHCYNGTNTCTCPGVKCCLLALCRLDLLSKH